MQDRLPIEEAVPKVIFITVFGTWLQFGWEPTDIRHFGGSGVSLLPKLSGNRLGIELDV